MSVTNKNKAKIDFSADETSEAGSPRISQNLLENKHTDDDQHEPRTYSFTSDSFIQPIQNEEEPHSQLKNRTGTLHEFTGEKDLSAVPETERKLDWWLFNSDMYSTDRTVKEVDEILGNN